jgi:hypothetical protein
MNIFEAMSAVTKLVWMMPNRNKNLCKTKIKN